MLIKGKLRKERNIKKTLGVQAIQTNFRQRGKNKGRKRGKGRRKKGRIKGRKERRETGRDLLLNYKINNEKEKTQNSKETVTHENIFFSKNNYFMPGKNKVNIHIVTSIFSILLSCILSYVY